MKLKKYINYKVLHLIELYNFDVKFVLIQLYMKKNYEFFRANQATSSYELAVIGTFSLPIMIVQTVMFCFWSSDYN